jgi:hypothetical protein
MLTLAAVILGFFAASETLTVSRSFFCLVLRLATC